MKSMGPSTVDAVNRALSLDSKNLEVLLNRAIRTLSMAKHRVSDPYRWTMGTMARNEFGAPTDPRSELATQWCAVGAVTVEAGDFGVGTLCVKFLDCTCSGIGSNGIMSLNDQGSHSEVMRAFDLAIQLAESLPVHDHRFIVP